MQLLLSTLRPASATSSISQSSFQAYTYTARQLAETKQGKDPLHNKHQVRQGLIKGHAIYNHIFDEHRSCIQSTTIIFLDGHNYTG